MPTNLIRRAGWGLGDQAFSSLTNFAVGAAVARTLGVADFGAFALVLFMAQLILSLSRAVGTEPQMVRYSGMSPETWRLATAQATGIALLVGCLTGVTGLVIGLVVSGPIGQALVALGTGLPALLVQDAWRFSFISAGRPQAAFLSDLIWAIVIFPLFAFLFISDNATILWLSFAYVAGAAVASVAGIFQSGGVMPTPTSSLRWLKEHLDLTPSFIGEVVVGRGASQLFFFAVAGIIGFVGVGSIRAAQIILGLPFVLMTGIHIIAIPEAIRALKVGTSKLRKGIFLLGAANAAVAMLFGAMALLIPDSTGEAIFAASWGPARAVLVPATLWMAALGAQGALIVGLRALAMAGRGFRARFLTASFVIVFGIGGALVGGTSGAAWGQAIGVALGVAVWVWQFRKGLQDRNQDVSLRQEANRQEAVIGEVDRILPERKQSGRAGDP